MENETQEELLDANQIMNDAVDKAGQLLMTKPHIAEIMLKQLLKCDPEHHAALQLLGLCKHRMGENAEAIEIIQTVLDLDPDNADNWNNLGLAYGGLNNAKKAIEAIHKAIELNPEQFLFKNNLALQYRNAGDYENAVKYIKMAIEVSEKPQLLLNLGGIYGEMKKIDKAHECFLRAIELDPEYPAAYVDIAITHMLKGNFKEGFEAYEWRVWYFPQMKYYQQSYDPQKLWNGKDNLNGKRVLLYGEQGAGDIIQFSRFIKNIKEKGAYTILNCPVTLDAVMKRVEGVDETNNKDIVNDNGDKFPEYDYQWPLMSTPHLLKIDHIDDQPYIKPATTTFTNYMKEEYGDTFNVGIVWAGSPSHPHDKRRSIPLKYFKAVQDVPGVKLFSLQLETGKRHYGTTYHNGNDKFQSDGNTIDYAEGCEDMKLVDLTKMIQTFDDTCTIIEGLDLVICCDTATAHLAAAMGKPTWVALPYNPDWRWMIEGDKSYWYSSMKLYRQEEKDNWAIVFEKIAKDLNETVLQNKR